MIWPFATRVEQAAPMGSRYEQKCFRTYDLPPGRSWESFRYLIEDLHNDTPIDECVTDDEAERDRLAAAGHEQCYHVRVTDRVTGEVTFLQRPEWPGHPEPSEGKP